MPPAPRFRHARRALLGLALAWTLTPAPRAAPLLPADILGPAPLDLPALLAPPPAPDSLVARGEQELMVRLQAERTPAQLALAQHYETLDVFKLLAPVLGPDCTAERLPLIAELFTQAYAAARPTIAAAKTGWDRPRPYQFNPALTPVLARSTSTSYPSGHATQAELFAVLLTALVPERAADWAEQSARVRWSRIVGGAHYPSDTIAGQVLGAALGHRMLASPRLRAALDAARAELARHLARPAA